MKLASDWKRVLRHAWSVRLLILAGLLSGLEAVLPLIEQLPIPRALYLATVIATPVVVMAAFIARIVAQKEFDE